MSDVPPEIHYEILIRLPVESLFRFRSVCKVWRDTIDNSNFAKKHIHGGIGGLWFFYRHYKCKIFISSINEMISKRSGIMHATNVKTLVGAGVPQLPIFDVPTCNGLILLSSCNDKMVWRIWNPFTGESLELEKCNELPDVAGEYPAVCGIGYDEANDDYKVVRIVGGINTFVYSVNLKLWHKIGDFPDSLIGCRYGAFADGAMHWIANSREPNGELGWIVALDISNKTYRKIALPLESKGHINPWNMILHALSGCLFLRCSNFKGKKLVMWMMKDYGRGDTWIKIMSFENIKCLWPLAYLQSEGRILLHHGGWKHFWYDVEKNSMELLNIEINVEHPNMHKYSSQIFPASLIRLKKTVVAKDNKDENDKNVASQLTPKRKGKKNKAAVERLPLKVFFNDPEDFSSGNAQPSSNAPASSN